MVVVRPYMSSVSIVIIHIRAGEIPKKISPPPKAHLMGPKNVPKKFGSSISSLAPPKICVFKNARFIKQSALKLALISPGSWLFYEI